MCQEILNAVQEVGYREGQGQRVVPYAGGRGAVALMAADEQRFGMWEAQHHDTGTAQYASCQTTRARPTW